jgi:hypothetical protein
MERFIARANIDHYTNLLNGSDLLHPNRTVITKMLIAEEDKLGHDLAQLEFAESRTARCRDRVNHARKLRDGFPDGSAERARADKVLENFQAIHELFERFCHHLRERTHSPDL